MHSSKPVVIGRFFDVLSIMNLVLFGLRDNLLAQNQSYTLLSCVVAFEYRFSIFESDKYSEMSSAKDSIFSLDDCAMSFT